MKRDEKLLLLFFGLAGIGAYLWLTKSGQEITSTAGSAVATGVRYVESLIRGERNNNPGNIRISAATWQGKVSPNTDGAFEQFDTPENGIRALAIILKNYQVKYGLNTVTGIITRWAPGTENDTGSYISHVADLVGVAPDDPLQLLSPQTLFLLTRAIIAHENGRVVYDDNTINAGVARALA
jgi:hypothetical protein